MAPDTLDVDVTVKDVAEGIPRHTDRCPVARAARRVLEKEKVSVFPLENPDEHFGLPSPVAVISITSLLFKPLHQ